MPIYIVRMEHPEGPVWNEFVLEHIAYLKTLIGTGSLLASGPVKGSPLRAGFLIFKADTVQAVRDLIDEDPFAREHIISAMTIEEWDPLFGALVEYSSKQSPFDLAAKT